MLDVGRIDTLGSSSRAIEDVHIPRIATGPEAPLSPAEQRIKQREYEIRVKRQKRLADEKAEKQAQKRENIAQILKVGKRAGVIALAAIGTALVADRVFGSDNPNIQAAYKLPGEEVSDVAGRLLIKCGVEDPSTQEINNIMPELRDQNPTLTDNSGETVADDGARLQLEC